MADSHQTCRQNLRQNLRQKEMADNHQNLRRKGVADSHQNHHRKGMADSRQSLLHTGNVDSRQSLLHTGMAGVGEMAIFSDLSLERPNLSDKEMADNLQIFLQTPRHTTEVSSPCLDYRKNQAGIRARIRVAVVG